MFLNILFLTAKNSCVPKWPRSFAANKVINDEIGFTDFENVICDAATWGLTNMSGRKIRVNRNIKFYFLIRFFFTFILGTYQTIYQFQVLLEINVRCVLYISLDFLRTIIR